MQYLAIRSRVSVGVCQICYGTTENSPVTFQSCSDDSLDKRVSTVGKVHPFVEVALSAASLFHTRSCVQPRLLHSLPYTSNFIFNHIFTTVRPILMKFGRSQ